MTTWIILLTVWTLLNLGERFLMRVSKRTLNVYEKSLDAIASDLERRERLLSKPYIHNCHDTRCDARLRKAHNCHDLTCRNHGPSRVAS